MYPDTGGGQGNGQAGIEAGEVMKMSDDIQASLYVDGQLSQDEVQETVQAMYQSPELRREVDEIQDLKALMKQAFPVAHERADEKVSETPTHYRWIASAAAVVLAFVLGLLFPGMGEEQGDAPRVAVDQGQKTPVILHVPDRDPNNWANALDIAEAFGNRHVRVEILANSYGLDLLSAKRSPYAKRVKALAAKYPELAFVACASGLAKLRKSGIDTGLLEGVSTAPSAVEHVAEKVSEGWRYIKL